MKNKSKELISDNPQKVSKTSVSNHEPAILAEQIRLLYQQTTSAFPATLIIATVLVWVFSGHVSENLLTSWLAAIYLLTFIRLILVLVYFRRNPPATEAITWGRLFIFGVFVSGLVWGTAGSIFFIADSAIHQLFLAYLLGGLVAGAMSTLSSYKGAFLVFSVPIILPYTYQVIIYGHETYTAIAVTYLLFLFMMLRVSQRLHHTLTDSLHLRFEKSDLLNNLFLARDHQNKINLQLQIQIAKKDQVEHALQNLNELLEQRVIERTQALSLSNIILLQEKELFRVTLASIGDAVITTNSHGYITYLNPTAELFTGWSNREAKNSPLQNIFLIRDIATHNPIMGLLDSCLNKAKKYHANQECQLISKDKQESIIDYSVAPIHDDKEDIIGAILTFRDVTEKRKLTQKLAYQAAHDPLTGLLNRDEFESRLTKVLASIHINDIYTHALLYLDLDQFKVVNDTCGHSAGDEMLRQVTALLHSKLRTRDTLARLGGDEFGIILEHCPQKEAQHVANTLREVVQDFRFQWQGKIFTIGVSIGLFPINQCNVSLSNALSAADSACYIAKEGGRNRVHVCQFDDSVLLKRTGEMQWLQRIQLAMDENRLCLYFQPIIPISNNNKLKEHGEILLRLMDEQGKLILPGTFLPSAERFDQMIMIDRWVVKQSLKLLKTHAQHQTEIMYAINLSAQALGDENFLDFVVENIKAHKINPSCLCFEITENVALADLKHVVRFISTLKNLGCRFSMDDFGSGLSSFGYLKDIPLDYLKIDGRLVKDMISDPIDHAMVEAIHSIGHVMELETVAEWVEDSNTMLLLKKMGIDYAQGFFLAKPYLIEKMNKDG